MVIKARRKILKEAEIKKVTQAFYNVLVRDSIPFQDLFLFGSYAEGKPHKDSDIDIAVVVPSGISLEKRKKLMNISWIAKQVDVKLEPHIISVRDFNNAWLSFPAQVKKTGKKIGV